MAATVRIKVCGITNREDALDAAYEGAWAQGFIFYKKSPRYVSPSKVKKIIEALPPFVTPVGVFVNQNEGAIRDICSFTRIKTIQLHGDEDPIFCSHLKEYKVIKAFRLKDRIDLSHLSSYKTVDAFLFDTFQEHSFGGTGKTFSWDILKDTKINKPFILAGGLNIQNVKEALGEVSAYAIDISSGIEKSPGIKDHRLMKEFFEYVHHHF